MERTWVSRVVMVVGITLLSIWFLIPTYYSLVKMPREQRNDVKALEAAMPSWAPSARYRVNLGLDLQGGIQMVMRVDTRTALQNRVERRGIELARYLKDKNLGEVTSEADPERLELKLTAQDPSKLDAIQKELEIADDFSIAGREGDSLRLSLKDQYSQTFREDAVDQAMLVIRRRIDKWGVAEVDVRKSGADAIQISLPGQQNPDEAKQVIGQTAQLEFRMVDDQSTALSEALTKTPPPAEAGITVDSSDEGFPQLVSKNREALLAYAKDKVPDNREVVLTCKESRQKGVACDEYRTYVVEKAVPLTGDSLVSAGVDANNLTGDPEVNITFNAQGAREFAELTEKNVGRRMAIVLDENVNSAPRINEKIPGGTARITLGKGAKTRDELINDAKTLSLVLKAGALPAPVTAGEIRQVGASLGDELIRKGSLAALVGVILVLIFMAIYYRGAGLIADVALVLNGILILAGLAFFNATLTLPGIAGFVLTLGMAVDANVLINERIREELRNGKSARAAVDQGYDRAFWTIFDANITTLIAAVILFFTGTGPVQGFATTLIIGLLASMFTAIVVTRVITTYFVHHRNAQSVSV